MNARIRNSRMTMASLALGVALAFAAGCGGDGGSSSTSTDSGSAKQQYIADADAVCAKYNAELNAKIADEFGGKPTTPSKLSKFTEDVTIPLLERQYKAFAAVPIPASELGQVNAIIAAVNKALDASRKDPSALFGGSAQGPGAFDEANQLEADYGFTQCGGGASP